MDTLTARGFSTLEILIAMVIAVSTITAVILVFFGGQSTILSAQTNAEAVTKAEQLVEAAQALARHDFNLVNAVATTTDGVYQKSVTVELQSDYLTKLVTTFVSWIGDHGQELHTRIDTLVTNLENVSSPNTCNSTLTNAAGWKAPDHQVYDFGQLGLNSNNGNGYEVSSIQAFRGILYVTMVDTPNTDQSTLVTFKIPNDPTTQAPVLLSKVDNNSAVGVGLAGTVIASTTNRVYLLAANPYEAIFHTCINTTGTNKSCAQLQIFDVTDPAALAQAIYNFKLSTTSPSFVNGTSAGQATGNSIFYRDGYVYLGLTATQSGPEFNVIDVGGGGTPASFTNPIWKGGYVVGNGVNSIFVKGKYAYITSPNSQNLKIIDVQVGSPTFMQLVGSYSPPNAPQSEGVGSNHGRAATVVGDTVYLGRTYGAKEVYILNASAPSTPTVSGSLDVGSGNLTSVYGLALRENLVFLLTKSQFQVWDVGNPGTIVPWTVSGTNAEFSDAQHDLGQFGNGGAGTSLDCEGNYIYTALASTQGNTKDMLAVLYPGAPAFDYTVLASPLSQSIKQGLTGSVTVTVTKTSTATALPVSITLSGFQNNVSYLPLTGSCTPTSGSCSVTFTVTAASNAQKVTRTVTVTGTVPTRTTEFELTITP